MLGSWAAVSKSDQAPRKRTTSPELGLTSAQPGHGAGRGSVVRFDDRGGRQFLVHRVCAGRSVHAELVVGVFVTVQQVARPGTGDRDRVGLLPDSQPQFVPACGPWRRMGEPDPTRVTGFLHILADGHRARLTSWRRHRNQTESKEASHGSWRGAIRCAAAARQSASVPDAGRAEVLDLPGAAMRFPHDLNRGHRSLRVRAHHDHTHWLVHKSPALRARHTSPNPK